MKYLKLTDSNGHPRFCAARTDKDIYIFIVNFEVRFLKKFEQWNTFLINSFSSPNYSLFYFQVDLTQAI